MDLLDKKFYAPILSRSEVGNRLDILFIAGEHSGDEHASHIIKAFQKNDPKISICGIGGPLMRLAGAELLYDFTQHAVIGLFEVLKSYPFFLQFFKALIIWIMQYKPRNICFVDFSGFNLRVAKRLYRNGISQKAGGSIRLHYYISPQIWASRSYRRFAMARYIDHLGVIFPFEIDCYKDTQLDVEFVGHPLVAENCKLLVKYSPRGPLLLLPGSRRQSIEKILPLMMSVFSVMAKNYPSLTACVIYPNSMVKLLVESILSRWPEITSRINILSNDKPVLGSLALTVSGTMSLQCALAGIPGIIVYRTSMLTYLLCRMLLHISYIGIANILLNKPVYDEYIQHNARSDFLVAALENHLFNMESRTKAKLNAIDLRKALRSEQQGCPADWLRSNI